MQRTVCSYCQCSISESVHHSRMFQAGAKTENRPALFTRMCRGWSLALNLLTKLQIFSKLPTLHELHIVAAQRGVDGIRCPAQRSSMGVARLGSQQSMLAVPTELHGPPPAP